MPALLPLSAAGTADLSGLAGWVADVMSALGAVGVGLLTLLETVFPPVPSEVVLPLAGFLAQQGRMGLAAVLVAATLGSVAGALVLYELGRRLGQHRAMALLARMPLVESSDVDSAAAWFDRHGPIAVLVGRLAPGVRSLVSLPAGAARMNVLLFTGLTALGSAAWNALLVGAGVLLGTQWQRVEEYSWVLDVLLVGAVAVLVGLGLRRRLRRRRAARASAEARASRPSTTQ